MLKQKLFVRRLLEKERGEQVGLFPSGIYHIVHSTDINLCEYSNATLFRCGLRGEDHVEAFGRLLRNKIILTRQRKYEVLLTPEGFTKTLDERPLPELYNAI